MVWLRCWSGWVRELRVGSGPSDDWCYHTADQTRAPTCPSFAFARVDLTSLGGLDDLGLVAVGPGRAVADHASMASFARCLGVCWHTANTADTLQGKTCSNTTRCAGRAFR